MTIMRPRVFPEVPSLREAIDRLFDDSFVSPRGWFPIEADDRPAIDAYTTPEAFVVEAAMPGIKADEIQTTVTGDVLTIEGKYREEATRDERGYIYRELKTGMVRRSISLPKGLKTDAAEATYAEGILTLKFPKAEEAKPRLIQVKAA